MPGVHIRKYKVEDGDDVEELFRHHTEKHLRRSTSLFYKKALDGEPPEDVVAVVAIASGRVVGFSGVKLLGEGKVMYPATIVHRDFRNRGIGKMLMKKKLEIAREKGLKEYTSIVGEENVASRRMLESLGNFEVVEKGKYDENKKWVKYAKKRF
ncbi:MAG: GNAT family N-acetyltransferase [Candidatus Jordarchaeaceae archaeon]